MNGVFNEWLVFPQGSPGDVRSMRLTIRPATVDQIDYKRTDEADHA